MYTNIEHYVDDDALACYPYLESPLSNPAPPAVFAATVDNVLDSAELRDAKNRFLSDIINDLVKVVTNGNQVINLGQRREVVGRALWLRRGPMTRRFAMQTRVVSAHFECNVMEELLHQRNPVASADMLTIIMEFAPSPVPRAVLRPIEQEIKDEGEDEYAVADGTELPPLLFAVLVVHCVTVLRKQYSFSDMSRCLTVCLQRTPEKDRAGSLVKARVAARKQTLFSFCCMWGQPKYALLVLRAIPENLLHDYICVVDDAHNTAEMYAREKGLTEVVRFLEQIGAVCHDVDTTPSAPSAEAEAVRARRKRRHQELVHSSIQQRVRADIEGADEEIDSSSSSSSSSDRRNQDDGSRNKVAKVIDPDDPDEIRIRLLLRRRSSGQRELLESVSLSRASYTQLVLNAPKWVECAYLPETAPLRKGGRRALDVEHIRQNARFYHTLSALGFDPNGHGRKTMVAVSGLAQVVGPATWASWVSPKIVDLVVHLDDKDVDSDRDTAAEATIEAVPWANIEALPPAHARVVNGHLDTSANAFQAFAPEEQRALVKYHHKYDELLNGMLRAQSADRGDVDDDPELAATNAFFQSALFLREQSRLGATVDAAVANIRETQQAIDRAFRSVRPLNDAITVFRGIRYTSPAFLAAQAESRRLPSSSAELTAGLEQSRKVGLQRGYTSTSAEESSAVKFVYDDPCCVQRIRLPKGMPVIFVESVAVEHKGEMEVLLPRGVEIVLDPSRRGSALRPGGGNPIPVVFCNAVLSPEGKAVLERAAALPQNTPQRREARVSDYGDEPRCALFRLATLQPPRR